ncbi:MAG: hypothetical protein GXY73_03195 [Methanothrix sp.]|jgi:hypothetical protein|nr:hypothetical protein [Methanothrix sp.]
MRRQSAILAVRETTEERWESLEIWIVGWRRGNCALESAQKVRDAGGGLGRHGDEDKDELPRLVTSIGGSL